MIRGADVSAWQDNINIATLAKTYGWTFIGIKASEGKSRTDSKFARNWAGAKAAGLVRIAYHFSRPEESSAVQQADRFLGIVKPVEGDLLCLDLEESDLSQAETNAWAIAFAARLKEKAPGNKRVIYAGRGYAANGTGKNLADHYQLWWFPQYDSMKATTTWPGSFSPALPDKLTIGWTEPHIWQWSSNFAGRFDVNVANLTIDQLAAGGLESPPMEEAMPYGGQLPAGAGKRVNISFPAGSEGAIGFVYDNPNKAKVRVAFHHKSGGGEVFTVEVGGPASDTDSWPKKVVVKFKDKAAGDWASLTRLDEDPDGTADPVGWDMS
jgi:GH25 family lysozyme M1 (1,4-beta-N-acetylmuramidase)